MTEKRIFKIKVIFCYNFLITLQICFSWQDKDVADKNVEVIVSAALTWQGVVSVKRTSKKKCTIPFLIKFSNMTQLQH